MVNTLRVLNNNFIPDNCFEFYSDNKIATNYQRRGMVRFHASFFAEDTSTRISRLKEAFSYFYLALRAKPDYFCSRTALVRTAEILETLGAGDGLEGVVEAEQYAVQTSDNPHPGVCHLMHGGWYSATDLAKMVRSSVTKDFTK